LHKTKLEGGGISPAATFKETASSFQDYLTYKPRTALTEVRIPSTSLLLDPRIAEVGISDLAKAHCAGESADVLTL